MDSRSKRGPSSKQVARKAALEKMKAVKEGRESRRLLDEEDSEDEDVYETVTEEQYQNLVRDRQKKNDFVVDDEGLGYADDGEEYLDDIGKEEEKGNGKRPGGGKSAAARKRARALNQAAAVGTGSITKYLQTSGTGVGPGLSSVATAKAAKPVKDLDIDDMLDGTGGSQLGRAPNSNKRRRTAGSLITPKGKGRRTSGGSGGSKGRQSGSGSANAATSRRGPSTAPVPSTWTVRDMEEDQENDQDGDHELPAYDPGDEVESPPPQPSASEPAPEATAEQPEAADPAPAPKKARSRLALLRGTNAIQASAATQAALEQAKALPKPAPEQQGQADKQAAPASAKEYLPGLDFTGTTYKFSSDTPAVEAASAPASASGNAWLRHDSAAAEGETGQAYVQMYWLDATEVEGRIYLFGKVETEEGSGKFISACAVVKGIERNLLVLPRRLPGQEVDEEGNPARADPMEVFQELQGLLTKCIGQGPGSVFRIKPVKRKYAFEYPDVPREEATYLKVKYSSSAPALPQKVCDEGGKHYQRIFGARTPLLETFLIKRKLMGPGWIKIRAPCVAGSPASWCKVEVVVDNPKAISRVIDSPPPAPPIVTLSISMKTAMHHTTHKHEVVAISTLLHRAVQTDGYSSEAAADMSAWTAVRPLGTTAGPQDPKVFPHDIDAAMAETKAQGCPLIKQPNERALLSYFFHRLQVDDPDVIVAHNLLGFDFDVLLQRAHDTKLDTWSKLGRLKRFKLPRSFSNNSGKSTFSASLASGRLMCDTYLSAKEFLSETTYSLTHLSNSQLGAKRTDVDPADVPRIIAGGSKEICRLAKHTAFDAGLVQQLMFKLQVIPLTKQLTSVSGNLWSRTMMSKRAERIEYLLLHEFHALKYVTPEKEGFGGRGGKTFKGTKGSHHKQDQGKVEMMDDDDLGTSDGGKSKAKGPAKKKSYAGGLVLEPKKGLYDQYILLLDFNSLYPSIIQEYNLCFTTTNWSDVMAEEDQAALAEGEADGAVPGMPLPDSSLPLGVLPRVIKQLVERRAVVKKMLKGEKDPARRQELDIRQKALKLTANSMYGCLGFPQSRFYARPIAATVTSMGREALQRTVQVTQDQMGLDVIYGDTDSVMVNTNSTDLKTVKELGAMVKKEVNKLYKCLELDLDGVFKSLLLLKKKKYGALIIKEGAGGEITYEKEMKGLDLVRRDWCVLSKETGKYVLDRILSGDQRESVVESIHEQLVALAAKMRAGELGLEKYVITKGISKPPNEYADVKTQPHLQVALAMLKAGKPVNVGNHIPYVICESENKNAPAAERAHHPEEVIRSAGQLKPDVNWYLDAQLVPPIARLCDPIEGTSKMILCEKLGLDAKKYASTAPNDEDHQDWAFTPTSLLSDEDRFRDCKPLRMTCSACGNENDFKGVFSWDLKAGVNSANDLSSGLTCPAPACGAQLWGGSEVGCFSRIYQRLSLTIRHHQRAYYNCWLQCDDSSCGRRTQQLSVLGAVCTARGCSGHMKQEYTDKQLYEQLKYLATLFDADRSAVKLAERYKLQAKDVSERLPRDHKQVLSLVHQRIAAEVENSSYNFIAPNVWSTMFSRAKKDKAVAKKGL